MADIKQAQIRPFLLRVKGLWFEVVLLVWHRHPLLKFQSLYFAVYILYPASKNVCLCKVLATVRARCAVLGEQNGNPSLPVARARPQINDCISFLYML